MCGIAGIVRFDDRPIDDDRLRRLLAVLSHRGTDGNGIATYARCGLVHARLSIIDLLSGQQPMHVAADPGATKHDRHGPLHLVFNGEVYNHRKLRKQLSRKGHHFASDHSDTEVLLLGFREWGLALPKHVHGMFAFAIWDEEKRELFICRDRAGKKPLYLHRHGNELSFASLPSALVAAMPDNESPAVNADALRNYLRLGYCFGQSLIDGVTELPVANWALISPDGAVRMESYWQPPPISKTSTALGAMSALREVLDEAVAARLQADVPLGCFLSGGIDSSVVTALAQHRLTEQGADRLKTFSIAMPAVGYDETPFATQVAQHLGTDHTTLTAEPGDVLDDLHDLMAVCGEPTADSSILPTHWLCRATRQHVKVTLSGDGGDELFGGYDRYRAMRLLAGGNRWWLATLPHDLLDSADPKSAGHRMARLIDAARAGRDPARHYRRMIHLFTEPQIAELMPDAAWPDMGPAPPCPHWPPDAHPVDAARRWDLMHYLPFEVLRKVDRASMAVALEVRCPMLATPVADLAMHLPHRVLMPGGRPKGLLRDLAASLDLPGEIVRRPKRGFALPLGQWLRTSLRDAAHGLIAEGSLAELGIAMPPVRRMLDEHDKGRRDHTHRLFALMQLALWQQWIKRPYTVDAA
ncbi:MAG: asparagine synthase (glutamine-hydrolyzing) [Planctomycetota bacterium]